MTRVNPEQARLLPWYAKAGASSSMVPLSRFVSDDFVALENGGYACLFHLSGVASESMTEQEMDSKNLSR